MPIIVIQLFFVVLQNATHWKGKGKEVKKASKRKSLSFVQKKELCEWIRDNPSYNQNDLAKKYDISKLQVSRILKEKEKWLCINIANKELSNQKRDRGAKFLEIESALYLWKFNNYG
ncbi:unnamed protein product [Rhizophagus irregularis]|nr:unnamed protein product [Rhizophagus irregularis]